MFFYLDYNHGFGKAIAIEQLAKDELPAQPASNVLYLQKGFQRLEVLEYVSGKLYIIGDPVFRRSTKLPIDICKEPGNIEAARLYEEVMGHYYWFYFYAGGLQIGTSFGSIFPVYYHLKNNGIIASSSSLFLAEHINIKEKDNRNLLERLLFNYPFFNSTWWKAIKLLEAHHVLKIQNNKISIEAKFDVSEHFGNPQNSSNDSLHQLTSLFEEESRLFFPNAPFAISLTGGFDGRTLVAAAKKAGKEFMTYSFGSAHSSDVRIPAAQSKRLNLPYYPIYLDQAYIEKKSLQAGWDFMQLTEYDGNFGRPHYQYAAQLLSEKVDYVITGNFGSELFRALHLPGVMMSENLIKLFSSENDSWKDEIRRTTQQWGMECFETELDALIADLEIYLKKMAGWDPNHKFYYFVYNEIFRKYFGPELVMQSQYFNNRTPYLNLRFFQELNHTMWSGIHARLFEKMKNKRIKGQMFYASFIKKADKKLYHFNTNKGYSPADILENWRFPFLVAKVLTHKYLVNKEVDDNSVDAFFSLHKTAIINQIIHRKELKDPENSILNYLIRLSEQKNVEQAIKLLSIAAGWDAANRSTHVSTRKYSVPL